MLNEYKEIYQQAVEQIPNWKQLSQMDLANKYHEKGPLCECYLAAEILKFWHIIDRTLYKDKGLYDELEVYDWYISAIMFALDQRPWDDPNSSIYNDPKAVEKVLNTVVTCSRINFFYASNRHKRKINHEANSLNVLQETYADSFFSDSLITEMDYSLPSDLIYNYCMNKDYLSGFIIDIIIRDIHIQNVPNTDMLVKNILRSIQSLPQEFAQNFSDAYGVSIEEVNKYLNILKTMSRQKLEKMVQVKIVAIKNKLESEN